MKKPITIRISVDVKAALLRLKQRNSRSMSGMVEHLIKQEALREGCYIHPPLSSVDKKVS